MNRNEEHRPDDERDANRVRLYERPTFEAAGSFRSETGLYCVVYKDPFGGGLM